MGNSSPDAPGRLFWTTGILGGLTTYSSLIGEIGAIWSQNKAVAVQVGVISIIAAGVAGLLAYRIRRQPGRGSQ
jgi:fluoride ion exporter CrcB/FEX